MNSLSQNTDQKATPKRHKIHRSHPEVSRKIIAFETISEANQGKSAREISKLINIPNSTMQSWKENLSVDEAMEDEASAFFRSPVGASLLHRIILSIIFNNKCGHSGILGAQECLHNSGLSKYVASSTGALQKFWERCEDCILTFGKEWEQKLAKGMKERKITVLMDEMFRKGMPCLVAIEAVSNYILLEKFTENRTSETWKKELDLAIKDVPVKIAQIGSDLCGAIALLRNHMKRRIAPIFSMGSMKLAKPSQGR